MSDLPVKFRDLPADCFPFTMEFYDVDTKEIYEVIHVDGPGATKINPKPAHVGRAGVKVRYANGKVVVQE